MRNVYIYRFNLPNAEVSLINQGHTLLATKFFSPPLTPNLVPRPRLLALLDVGLIQANAFSRKLTLISAAAGYGKTTLVSEWLDKWGKKKEYRAEGKENNGMPPGSPWTRAITTRHFSCHISSPR